MKATLFIVSQCWLLAPLAAQQPANSLHRTEQSVATASKTSWHDTAAAARRFRIAAANADADADYATAGAMYDSLGELHFRNQAHNRSLGAFIKAKTYFVKSGSEAHQAVANFKLGRTQYYRGNYKLALGHLRYAMQSAKQLKMRRLEADVLEYLGILYQALPAPGISNAALLQKALFLKQHLGDPNGALRLTQNLAAAYYDNGNFDSAEYYNKAALQLAEKLGLSYDATLARLNSIPALIRRNQWKAAQQQLHFSKAHTADVNLSLRYHTQAANLAVALGDTAAAEKSYDTALAVARNAGFPELAALVFRNAADAYYHAGNFKKAYAYQLALSNQVSGPYRVEMLNAYKELEAILKTNIAEDEVRRLHIQNKAKEARLENEQTLRVVLLIGAAGFLLSAIVIAMLYRRQQRKSRIIEKQAADLKTLMKEMHHRVKNNLQIIASLLDLQAHLTGDGAVSEALRESRNRVQTMALIHQNLYEESKGTEIEAYINDLTRNLFAAYNVRNEAVLLRTSIDPITPPADAVVLIGLVLNELISNALKHAFGAGGGVLQIALRRKDEGILLEVRDNGKGFPAGFDAEQTETFGYKLIKAFTRKLKARLKWYNEDGACVQLYLPKFKSTA